jgi:hypothetical protein
MADRMAVLHGGRIVWEGPADAVDSTGNPQVDEIVQPSLAARRTAVGAGIATDAPPAG